MKVMLIHATFTKRREKCLVSHQGNSLQEEEEEGKYLRLHLDTRLTWHKQIFTKQKQVAIAVTKICWLLGHKPKLSADNKLLLYKAITALGYGFHFQHGHSRMFPVESLAHDSGCTLVRAEYGYPKGSPKKKSSATALNTMLASVYTQMT
jgi:hypothetical protein